MERSHPTAGPGGRTLENLFHLMVVVLIETTDLLGFFGTLHLSANISVLRTVVRLNEDDPGRFQSFAGLHSWQG